MNVKEIKQFQAGNGIAIELADKLGLSIIARQLRIAMAMSVEYERLQGKVEAFTKEVADGS